MFRNPVRSTEFQETMQAATQPSISAPDAPLGSQEKVRASTPPPTYLDEPPTYDLKSLHPYDQKELIRDSDSFTTASLNPESFKPSSRFTPSKTLHVNAHGVRALRLPFPSSELQIPVTNEAGNVVYISTRAKKGSGNAILSNAESKELVSSEYQFGPGRHPKLRILQSKEGLEGEGGEIKVKGKWTSRTQEFTANGGETVFTWRYVHEPDPNPNSNHKKRTFLVMEAVTPTNEFTPQLKGKGKGKEDTGPRRVAQLIRTEQFRTPGTRSSHAGNGGVLAIDEAALKETIVGEEIVVATCLMMLKKEIDRRRAIQMAAIIGGAAGS